MLCFVHALTAALLSGHDFVTGGWPSRFIAVRSVSHRLYNVLASLFLRSFLLHIPSPITQPPPSCITLLLSVLLSSIDS